MPRPVGSLLLTAEELPLVERALVALMQNHGRECWCEPVCRSGRLILERVAEKRFTPTPRSAVDQGETG